MTLKVKSGVTRNVIEVHRVSRVWFEDGRVWYIQDGSSARFPYGYQLLEIYDRTIGNENTCICCGESIPEGTQICIKCNKER